MVTCKLYFFGGQKLKFQVMTDEIVRECDTAFDQVNHIFYAPKFDLWLTEQFVH